jgi:hypothetical protein
VRRLLPWALVVLLGAGTGLAAAAGNAGNPGTTPSQWVASVLSTTQAAGSARFTYSHVTTSSNPDLDDHMVGSGEVDFSSGRVRSTEVDHDVQFDSGPVGSQQRATPTTTRTLNVGIGTVEYQSVPSGLGVQRWIKMGLHRDPDSQLGLEFAANASVALSSLSGDQRVVATRDLGPATVDGVPTTRYVVTTAPLCAVSKKTAQSYRVSPTTMWINGQGRLVQVRDSFFSDVHPPAAFFRGKPGLAKLMNGPTATTATLHFSNFGTPLHIAAPPASSLLLPSESASGSATIRLDCASSHG